ncbi:hypothetical protein [Streptomyces sp. NPDC001889]
MPAPSLKPDFRLAGYKAVTPSVDTAFWISIAVNDTEMKSLAAHHSDDGRQSHYVLHDGTVTRGIPGEPQHIALHIQRDPEARTYRFAHAKLPLPAMGQSWLIASGCPPDAIRLPPGLGTTAADDATRSLQERLMGDGDHFALLTSYTRDDPALPQITVLLRALDEEGPLPFRVLLEEVDFISFTHTLREGGFATYREAISWWENHWKDEAVPLPPAPPPALRTSAPGLPPAGPSTTPMPGRTR